MNMSSKELSLGFRIEVPESADLKEQVLTALIEYEQEEETEEMDHIRNHNNYYLNKNTSNSNANRTDADCYQRLQEMENGVDAIMIKLLKFEESRIRLIPQMKAAVTQLWLLDEKLTNSKTDLISATVNYQAATNEVQSLKQHEKSADFEYENLQARNSLNMWKEKMEELKTVISMTSSEIVSIKSLIMDLEIRLNSYSMAAQLAEVYGDLYIMKNNLMALPPFQKSPEIHEERKVAPTKNFLNVMSELAFIAGAKKSDKDNTKNKVADQQKLVGMKSSIMESIVKKEKNLKVVPDNERGTEKKMEFTGPCLRPHSLSLLKNQKRIDLTGS